MKTEYTISQIAEKLHITTNKIRFYEKKGLLTPMRESQNRYRKFGEEDIFRLETILLYRRSEERRVGKEGRSRWWPYH